MSYFWLLGTVHPAGKKSENLCSPSFLLPLLQSEVGLYYRPRSRTAHILSCRGLQSVIPRALSVPPGNSLEMQFYSLTKTYCIQSGRWFPAVCALTSPLGDSVTSLTLRSTPLSGTREIQGHSRIEEKIQINGGNTGPVVDYVT